jgi:hypothetical protein
MWQQETSGIFEPPKTWQYIWLWRRKREEMLTAITEGPQFLPSKPSHVENTSCILKRNL